MGRKAADRESGRRPAAGARAIMTPNAKEPAAGLDPGAGGRVEPGAAQAGRALVRGVSAKDFSGRAISANAQMRGHLNRPVLADNQTLVLPVSMTDTAAGASRAFSFLRDAVTTTGLSSNVRDESAIGMIRLSPARTRIGSDDTLA